MGLDEFFQSTPWTPIGGNRDDLETTVLHADGQFADADAQVYERHETDPAVGVQPIAEQSPERDQ